MMTKSDVEKLAKAAENSGGIFDGNEIAGLLRSIANGSNVDSLIEAHGLESERDPVEVEVDEMFCTAATHCPRNSTCTCERD